jgi:hypothetical protein
MRKRFGKSGLNPVSISLSEPKIRHSVPAQRRVVRLMIALSFASACFGQGKQNTLQTGVVDAHGANWIPPTSTFASPPTSPATGAVYIFTDAGVVGTCSGGGNALATCRWSGTAWSAVSGGAGGGGGTPGGSNGQVQVNSSGSFAGQSSIFNGGALVQRAVECASGTVASAALTAAAANQEVTIQTGISGNVRWDQVTVSETTQFAGTTGLTVSMGRPGTNNYEMTGALVPLMLSSGGANFWTARPIPPQLSGTYSIVLNFAVTSGSVNAATNGALTWEVCGYAAR